MKNKKRTENKHADPNIWHRKKPKTKIIIIELVQGTHRVENEQAKLISPTMAYIMNLNVAHIHCHLKIHIESFDLEIISFDIRK